MTEKIRLTRVVLNNAPDTAFILSDAFIEQFQSLYDENFTGDEIGDDKYRYDLNIIALIDRMGESKSAHESCELVFKYIPEEMKEYFEIYYGDYGENADINFNRYFKDVLKQLLEGELTMEEAKKKYDRGEYIRSHSCCGHYYYHESIYEKVN
jgi:ribosomal protein L32